MQVQSKRRIALALATCTIVGLVSIDASGQKRRRRRSRRHTSAATVPAGDASLTNQSEPTVISTADTSAGKNASSATGTGSQTASESEEARMRRTITNLSGQVSQLGDKLSRMEEQQRTLVDMERLSRAEQRAENLRAQLRGVEAQQGDLQARAEQLDYEIQPENIERALAPFGTTHPEEAREARRRQLESERGRVRTQLESLAASRTHLESDIATADAEVNRLRTRLDAAITDSAQTPTTPADTTTNTSVPPPATNPPNSVPPNQ